jgi:hypothetical protein
MFNEHGWTERLAKCRRNPDKERPTSVYSTFQLGTTCRRVKYYDSQNVLVAVIFEYIKPDGTPAATGKPVPKMLLEDGIMYHNE